jgi:hypothetical protein
MIQYQTVLVIKIKGILMTDKASLVRVKNLLLRKSVLAGHWWCTPASPATQEVEVGRALSKSSPDKSARPYLKNKLKKKQEVWRHGSSGRTLA